MKKLIFPATSRVHLARQKSLLDHLARYFEIYVTTYGEKDLNMSEVAVDIAGKFQKALNTIKPDLALIRGDRYEMLVPAMLCAYNSIPIAHIEGFDLSGAIDNKVRYAISHLSDYHFVTNEESYDRAKAMGFKNVWNFGSLDVEYALKSSQTLGTEPGKAKQPYMMVLYHPVSNEDSNEVFEALKNFPDYKIIGIKSNKDYGLQTYTEEYSSEEFIKLLKGASCLIGNSSAGIKEAPALGVSVVNIGDRQMNRLKSNNIIDVACEADLITKAIDWQLKHKYEPDVTYSQENTSGLIAEVIYGTYPQQI